jgi:Ca2+-binding RTX toxin-like protein
VVAGGDGNDRLYGGSDADQVLGGNGNDRGAGNKGPDSVQGGDGNDSLFGGWGADRVLGGSGNDELHALAPDGDPDLLNCGPGNDKAWVLRAERPRTQLVGCETVYVVEAATPDQDEGENADADTEADG